MPGRRRYLDAEPAGDGGGSGVDPEMAVAASNVPLR
jgi:hypothetical protein